MYYFLEESKQEGPPQTLPLNLTIEWGLYESLLIRSLMGRLS